MHATPQHVKQYEDEGYTLIRGLIPRDLCAQVRKHIFEVVVEGKHGWPKERFQVLDPSRYKRADGQPLAGGIQRPGKHGPPYTTMAEHPNLRAAMAALLDGEVQLFTDQLLIKFGRITEQQGGRTFYHQDSYYWKLDPQLGCNVWIALDQVGKDAIALAIMPGSHKGWQLVEHEHYYDDPAWCGPDGKPFQRHRIPQSQVDFRREVLVPMNPGDALFFTNFTWHRSEPNRTGRDLAAYAIAYRLTPEAAKARVAVGVGR